MIEKITYTCKKLEYSGVVSDLESYKSDLENYVAEIKNQLKILESVGEGGIRFYGQVCRNFMSKTNILYDDLNTMVSDMEGRISTIDESISEARRIHEKYTELARKVD